MEHSLWVNTLMERLCDVGDEGRIAMEYILNNKTKIGFKRVRPNIGAFWTVFGNINLNSHYYGYDTSMEDLRLKTLVIHEVRHLQQGFLTAFSAYGELDAWQLEFRIYHRIKGRYPSSAIADLMALPLEYDRAVLGKAVNLMQTYAGRGYRADLLPLFPVGREIKYWVFGS